jgi:D-3-phosphoglycerate dehydrogenase
MNFKAACRDCARKKSMSDTVVEALILDLLEWVANGERSYEEAMDAWRTSCPKLPVWEDANDRGLVMRGEANGHCVVRITPLGLAHLKRRNRSSAQSATSGAAEMTAV